MPQQQIIWTALPNGVTQDETTLMLSVVASPRLRLDDGGTGTLQSFPDFLDWPAHIQQTLSGFDLIVDGEETAIPATIVAGASAQPSASDLWKALFLPTTPVISQQFQQFQQKVVSTYPVSGVAANLQSGYTQLAQNAPFRPADQATFKRSFANLVAATAPAPSPAGAPLRTRLTTLHTQSAEDLTQTHDELAASLLRPEPEMSFDDKLAGITQVAGMIARSAPSGKIGRLVPESAGPLAAFAAFHGRVARPAVTGFDAPPPPDNTIDFHRSLTALGEYSWLSRRLGLIFDLTVTLTADVSKRLTSPIGALRQIAARPRFSSSAAGATSVTVATKYILDNDPKGPLPFQVFVAAPKAAVAQATIQTQFEIVAGLLNLGLTRPPPLPNDLQFDVFNVDVDGATRKVLNAIQTVAGDGSQSATAEVAAPALQTSGLMLARAGQSKFLTDGMTSAGALETAHQAGQPVVLFAEDLVRGYRIDIRHFEPGAQPTDPQPPWLSLHQRSADFRFKRDGASDLTVSGMADEGCVQPVLLQDPSGDPNLIYIHESYAHWQGWSLSAPLPANPVGLTRGDTTPPDAPAGLKQVEVTVQAKPGSLPRLRFGHAYQMRARTVDLAGNGLTPLQADDVLNNLGPRPVPFLPIQGQQLPYRRFDPIVSPVLVLGEELTEGEAIDVMVIRSNGGTTTTASYAASLGDVRYHGFNDRHIAPPKSTQRMSERHGKFDDAFGLGSQPQSVFGMFSRGSGTFNDTSIINLQTGQAEPLPDVTRPGPGGTQTTFPNGLKFIKTDQAIDPNSGYSVHYEDQLRLPYLPDAIADGAALFGLPGLTQNESQILIESTTPGTDGKLSLLSGDDQLLPPDALNTLGPVTKIGFPPNGQWPELRCFRLRLDGLGPADSKIPGWTDASGPRILTVRLAPAETCTIWISSYPRPEDVALFGLHFSWSRLGAPEGEREFIQFAQHGALAMLTPARQVTLVHAVQQPLIAPQVDGTAFATPRFPGDTVAYVAGRFTFHGKSTERIDLQASWNEPQPDAETTRPVDTHVLEVPIHLNADPPNIHNDPVPIAAYSETTFEFNAPTSKPATGAPTFLARHEFGDTKHRHVTYRLVATTRFKEYFPARITADPANITRVSTFVIDVPNSVRPPALEIARIVPAFKWKRSTDQTSSKRSGGWLRVYLGSTWFATGEGEAVAIVGDPAAGADPIHATPSATAPSTIIPKVTPVTIGGQKVYPFVPHRDNVLGLWYADLAFDVTGLYFPFVRLQLARVQPQSLDQCWFSPIVEAGFYQLAPDRTAALTFVNAVQGQPDKHRIDMTISGPPAPAAALTAGEHLTYTVEVGVEERPLVAVGDQRDPHLGWKPSATIVPVAAPSPGTLWHGSVIVPAIADMERRIVIKEFEIFPPNDPPNDPSNDPPAGQAWSGEAAGSPRRRLVYAETIAVH